jgi:hypothetical protein
LLEYLNQWRYESAVCRKDVDGLLKADTEATRLHLLKGWAAYKSLLDTQKYMEASHYDIFVLSQAFPRFPFFKNLYICPDHLNLDPESPFQRAFKDTLAIPSGMLYCKNTVTEARALKSIFLAAFSMQTKLKTLKTHSLHWTFFNPSPTEFNFCRRAFTFLRHLDLAFSADLREREENATVTARHIEFARALCTATSLETLCLIIGETSMSEDSIIAQHKTTVPVMWANIFQGMTWKSLRHLSLHGVTVSEECITNFVKNHSRNLTVLRLSNMWLTETQIGWDHVFTDMMLNLRLDVVQFKGLWGWKDQDGLHHLLKMRLEGKHFEEMIMGYFEMLNYIENLGNEEYSSDEEE